MQPQPTQPPKIREKWLIFEGKCVFENEKAILHPLVDPNVEIVFSLEDVTVPTDPLSTVSELYVRNGARIRSYEDVTVPADPSSTVSEVYVRNGAQILGYVVPPGSKFFAAQPKLVTSPACDSGPTCCLYGLQYCCDNNRVVDNCNGLWKCGD